MTVKDLIKVLEQIEDKSQDVVINSHDYGDVVADIVSEEEVYYGKDENGGWSCEVRKCVVIE